MRNYLVVVVTIIALTSCFSKTNRTHETDRNLLTVTIPPQQYFLQQIVGDRFTVHTLIPSGMNHETYDPPPSSMVALGRSALYFKVGSLGFENVWSNRLAKNNPNVTIIDCSVGIEMLASDHICCACGGHSHHDHTHGTMDPHTWTSPATVRIIAKNMLEAVMNLDPGNADYYTANYHSLMETINQTDQTIRDILQHASSTSFIIYHPALGYFAHEYGLTQHSIEFDGKSPSPAQMRNLVDIAREEQIKIIFVQRGFDVKNAETIANEINATVHDINPLAYEWNEELIRIATLLAGKDGQ